MVSVRDIINSPALSGIEVIAGYGGLGREVRSVTLMDAPDSPKWLKGYELLLSSAYLFDHNDELFLDHVTQMHTAGSSGIAVKIGRYISGVPAEVEKFAAKNDFPVLKIPYHLVWTDIISAFYKMHYGVEQSRHTIRSDPESVASLVEALKWSSHRFVERLTELFSIPVVLITKSGFILAENDIPGVKHLKALLKSGMFFAESATEEVHELEGLLIGTRTVPTLLHGKHEYFLYGVTERENLQEMADLFELIERFMSVDAGSVWDEGHHYRHFMMRAISGKITLDEIRSFEKNRALQGCIYSGIILLTGKNYQDVFNEIQGIAKQLRSRKCAALPPRLLYNKAAGEAMLLVEFQSEEPTPDINSWLNALIDEVDDELIAKGDGCIALGNMHRTLEEIPRAIQEAEEARDVGQLLWMYNRKYRYSGLSAYIMLRDADLSQVDFNVVDLLKNSDALSFDGVEAIEAFMDCRNYKLAAARLFIHENTLRYRIQKISELLNLNLDDPPVSHNILMKIKLWKLLINQG